MLSRTRPPRNGGFLDLEAGVPVGTVSMTQPQPQRLALIGAMAVGLIFVLFLVPFLSDKHRDAIADGVRPEPEGLLDSYPIAIITDLDHASKVSDKQWKSIFKRGVLRRDPRTNRFSVEWDDDLLLFSAHNEAGRGMELSDLVYFDEKLYTFDDRTGLVYEIVDFRTNHARVYPRFILLEGNSHTDKGAKTEWATVKDGKLYIGSFGKEYSLEDGSIKNENNNWVKIISKDGRVDHVDWSDNYKKMRKVLGFEFPKYILHETGLWSRETRRWVFLPRRMSTEPYSDKLDESKGANTMIFASEDFSQIETRTVGVLTPERGFSSAKFVPGSKDTLIVALKSEENSDLNKQASFITVFNTQGEVLMDETPIPGAHKYEGIEFLH